MDGKVTNIDGKVVLEFDEYNLPVALEEVGREVRRALRAAFKGKASVVRLEHPDGRQFVITVAEELIT